MRSPGDSDLGGDGQASAGDAFGSARPEVPSARAFALCLLLSAALQIMENVLPRLPVFPWLKLGLSHVVLLPFLLRYGPAAAGALLLGRNLLTLLFAAGPLSTFLIGTASGLLAIGAGGWLVRAAVERGLLGLLGAGMAMAALMNLAQLAVVEALFIRHAAFWFQLAPMLLWSALSGAAVAWLARRSRSVLEPLFEERDSDAVSRDEGSRRHPAAFLACAAAVAGLFALDSLPGQAAALALLLGFSAWRRTLRAGLVNILRAWPWFFYLAWLHLFFGDGEYLAGGFVTRPGAEAFLLYAARLASLVLLGPHLAESFPRHWLTGRASPYARGLVATLPLLPGLHAAALGAGRAFFRALKEGEAVGGGGEARVLRGLADGFREALGSAGAGGGRRQ